MRQADWATFYQLTFRLEFDDDDDGGVVIDSVGDNDSFVWVRRRTIMMKITKRLFRVKFGDDYDKKAFRLRSSAHPSSSIR